LAGGELRLATSMREQFPDELATEPGLAAWIDASEAAALERAAASQQERRDAEKRLREERDRALLMQPLFPTAEARQALGQGDSGTAILLALEALPDPELGRDRPWTPEPVALLTQAVARHSEAAVCLGHDGAVRAMRLERSGQLTVTCGEDATVRVWRVADGAALGLLVPARATPVRRLLVSTDRSQVGVFWHDGRFDMVPLPERDDAILASARSTTLRDRCAGRPRHRWRRPGNAAARRVAATAVARWGGVGR